MFPLFPCNLSEGAERRNPIVEAVEKVGSAVANISTERLVVERSTDPFFSGRSELFREFFESYFGTYEKKKVETPLGSGVIIDPEGYIVTNEHVTSAASKLTISLSDGSQYEAQLISSDPEVDLAILKIDAGKPLPYVRLGTSSDLMIGETVVALGNPLGFENSVTTGVMSAVNRTITFPGKYGEIKYEGLLQTDALINPGNSGGPLVNINGELIGINMAIIATAQGIGFAIPVDKVKEALVKLFNFQEINRVWLGLRVKEPAGGGVVVDVVEEKSPAQKAGIHAGDVVTAVDSKRVTDVIEFEKYLLKKNAGDKLSVHVNRDGREKTFKVTLEKLPVPPAEQLARAKLGLEVQAFTPELASKLGIDWLTEGVLISGVDPRSPAGEAGMEPGMVIISLGDYKISSLEEMARLLDKVKSGDRVDVGLAWVDRFGAHRGYARLRAK
ncbi:MAG TPA: trypsin-like peptidase domain-containing protein [Candidatus Hypogeohydataceae bacterium YC40]